MGLCDGSPRRLLQSLCHCLDDLTSKTAVLLGYHRKALVFLSDILLHISIIFQDLNNTGFRLSMVLLSQFTSDECPAMPLHGAPRPPPLWTSLLGKGVSGALAQGGTRVSLFPKVRQGSPFSRRDLCLLQ